MGSPTVCETINGIPYLVNAFWTAAQRQGHPVHEISYRACFKPQLPHFFITRTTGAGDVVHDPFMGRGTTPIEAALLSRVPSGNDINPLCVLLTRPRLYTPDRKTLRRHLTRIPWQTGCIENPELLAFYHRQTLRDLSALRSWLLTHAPLGHPTPDPDIDWIRMVALNRLTGHSSGYFSGRTMPPNQAVSVASQLKINARLGISPPPRDIAAIILKKTASLLRGTPVPVTATHNFATGPAWATPNIAAASVALVVTSPPFLNIVQYAEDNWLRAWFAGIDMAGVAITKHAGVAAWQAMVRQVLIEQARILRPGGYVAFEVGEVQRGTEPLETRVWSAAENLPFARLGVMVNSQSFTKTAQCWGISNNTGGTNTNRIVLLRRYA